MPSIAVAIDSTATLTAPGVVGIADWIDCVGSLTASPSVITDTSNITFSEPISFGVHAHANADQYPIPILLTRPILGPTNPGILAEEDPATDSDPASVPVWHRQRLLASVYFNLPNPIFIAGKPMLPAIFGNFTDTMTVHQGSGHARAVPDPDPVVSGEKPPTKGGGDDGAGQARWTVYDLPNPAGYTGQFYWLGDPTSADGSSSYADAGTHQWAPNSTTTLGSSPSWHSAFPFKPSVREHVWFGPNGHQETITKGVRFNTEFIEHMWIDMGSGAGSDPPLTWVITGLVQHFDFQEHENVILDSGKSPAASGVHYNADDCWRISSLGADPNSYRMAMAVKHSRMATFTSMTQSQKTLYTPFVHDYKPKVFFSVVDGTHSFTGTMAPDGKRVKKGSLDVAGLHLRHLVLGRKNGVLARRHSAHFVCFEIRFWSRALDMDEMHGQYAQLSSTWRFHRYY